MSAGPSGRDSLEGLKLKLQYLGHLMQRTDSLEKTLMLGNIEGVWFCLVSGVNVQVAGGGWHSLGWRRGEWGLPTELTAEMEFCVLVWPMHVP